MIEPSGAASNDPDDDHEDSHPDWADSSDLEEWAVQTARDLLAGKRAGRYADEGFDSFLEWACSKGISAWTARRLLDLGRTMIVFPSLGAEVAARRISLAAALALTPVAGDPAVLRLPPGAPLPLSETEAAERWLTAARTLSREDLTQAVDVAVERVRVWPEPVGKMQFDLDLDQYRKLERIQSLLSEKYERRISRGEMLGIMAEHYLDRRDPAWRERFGPGA